MRPGLSLGGSERVAFGVKAGASLRIAQGDIELGSDSFVESRTQGDDYRIGGWGIGDDHCSALGCSNSRLSSTCSRQSPWSSVITCPAIKASNCSLCP